MTARAYDLVYATLLLILFLLICCASALASWTVGVAGTRTGEARAAAAPTAPTGVAAACTSPISTKIKVTWTAVSHSSNYEIWQSTTSATSGFSVVATGVSGVSWTSGSLATGKYWFEVSAFIGTNWTSPNSTASAQRTIAVTVCS